MKYNTIACGGTFDLLHSGHEYFLDSVINLSENVILGLTSDDYIKQNKANRGIASYDERKTALEKYLSFKNSLDRVKFMPIDDLYGPLLDPDLAVQAIAVTDESKDTADLINKKRVESGLSLLQVEIVNQLKDTSNTVISATRVRVGEIDRTGNLLLPVSLRHAFQTAWGEILEEIPQIDGSSVIITVGDITTAKFIQHGITPDLCVIDNVVERIAVTSPITFQNTQKMFHIVNPAGTINKKIFDILDEIFVSNNEAVIEVNGEEDLFVLPILVKAPLGAQVFYGQPHSGLVRVIVSDEIKEKANTLLKQFDTDRTV